MEKIHGTSAHISFKGGKLNVFSGGEKHVNFTKLFATPEEVKEYELRYAAHIEELKVTEKKKMRALQKIDQNTFWDLKEMRAKFEAFGDYSQFEGITVYGEAYGGRQQGMKDTYGPDLKFVAFEVLIGDCWLDVPKAHKVANDLGFEFVHYVKCNTDLETLNAERDKDSTQAVRNGMGSGHKSEGIVIRPPIELTMNNGARLMVKHKRDDFRETRLPRKMGREKLLVLSNAREVANEWVVEERMSHVLDKIAAEGYDITAMESTGRVVRAMTNDVKVEGEGEIKWSKEVAKAVGSEAARMYKRRVTKI